jgi:biopolymer transport protein ExbD
MAIIRGREKKGDVEIFTASMADIVFLLIVFFVLTYKVEVDRTRVDLPETWVRSEVPKKAAVVSISPYPEQLIRVSSGENMAIPVNSDEEIVSFAATVVAQNPNKEFIVKADEGVRYEKVDVVLDALKQSKVKIIYLLSDQKTIDG